MSDRIFEYSVYNIPNGSTQMAIERLLNSIAERGFRIVSVTESFVVAEKTVSGYCDLSLHAVLNAPLGEEPEAQGRLGETANFR